MWRQLNPILVLACGFLSGCMSAPPIDLTAHKPAPDLEIYESADGTEYDLSKPAHRQRMLNEVLDEEIKQTPPGSLVRVVDESDRSYTGTLLKGTKDRVELMNAICKEAVPGPGGQQQCKTSHTPILSFETSAVLSFTAFSPPASDFVAPDINEDGRCITVADIIYKDGHSQSERYASIMASSSSETQSETNEQDSAGRATLSSE